MATLNNIKPDNFDLTHYSDDEFATSLAVTDENGAVDLSGKTLKLQVKKQKKDPESWALIDISTDSEISISGANNNIVTFSGVYDIDSDIYHYDLENYTDKETISYGRFIAKPYNSVTANEDIETYRNDIFDLSFSVRDSSGDPVDLSGKSLTMEIWRNKGFPNIEVLTTPDDISASNNVVTIDKHLTLHNDTYYYRLVNTTDDLTVMYGKLLVTNDVTR